MDIKIFANKRIISNAQELGIDANFTENQDVTADVVVINSPEDFYIPNKQAFILLNTDEEFPDNQVFAVQYPRSEGIISTERNALMDNKRYVITYGYNSRATVTASSTVDDTRKMVCLQRKIRTLFGEEIEPQELYFENTPDDTLLPCAIIKLINA